MKRKLLLYVLAISIYILVWVMSHDNNVQVLYIITVKAFGFAVCGSVVYVVCMYLSWYFSPQLGLWKFIQEYFLSWRYFFDGMKMMIRNFAAAFSGSLLVVGVVTLVFPQLWSGDFPIVVGVCALAELAGVGGAHVSQLETEKRIARKE